MNKNWRKVADHNIVIGTQAIGNVDLQFSLYKSYDHNLDRKLEVKRRKINIVSILDLKEMFGINVWYVSWSAGHFEHTA